MSIAFYSFDALLLVTFVYMCVHMHVRMYVHSIYVCMCIK